MNRCETILVSPEMTTLIGHGTVDRRSLPQDPLILVFALGGVGQRATLRLADIATEELGSAPEGPSSLTFAVEHAAVERLFGWRAGASHDQRFHITSTMREIALTLRDCALAGEARTAYRLAKSIELLCVAAEALRDGTLVPVADDGALSLGDASRVVAARRMIDERWTEKLTLCEIARACGINRGKLTRGFRELYRCSITEAIAERRLVEASRRLLTTDLPVSTIGYQTGYLNNASFARAFGRRFGRSPSDYRADRMAA
jgi:AraC family transcriptional regulator, transcriptional activator of the genes for pyochelin and ferripyochelin receptors